LFSYTCRDGSEVLADSFRISGLTVIVKAFCDLHARTSHVERCMVSVLKYTCKSIERSPGMMRELGDACGLVRQVGFYAEAGVPTLVPALRTLDFERLAQGADERSVAQMRHALRRSGALQVHTPDAAASFSGAQREGS